MSYHFIISGDPIISNPFNPFNLFKGSERNRRLDLVVKLHKGIKQNQLDKYNGHIMEDLEVLQKAGLIHKKGEWFYPTFFVGLNDEIKNFPDIALEFAEGLSLPIQDWLSEIRLCFHGLPISKKFTWEKIGFLIIGSFILHLNREIITHSGGKMLKENPPKRTGGKYFFQLIQTDSPELLGKFKERGQNFGNFYCGLFGTEQGEKEGSYPPFGFFPFFKKMGPIMGKKLASEVLDAYRDYYISGEEPPEELIHFLKNLLLLDSEKNPQIPLFSPTEENRLNLLAEKIGEKIGLFFGQFSPSLLNTFYCLPASSYTSFAEFFNWFYFLVADKCLEIMAEQGLISFPKQGYQAFISSRGFKK